MEGYKKCIHNQCGKPAFLYKDKTYYKKQVMNSSDVLHMNGESFKMYEVAFCDNCGDKVMPILEEDGNVITCRTAN